MKQRNVFQADLQIVSELVLEDIIKSRDLEPRFLAECYSQSGALSQYALVSKSILSARYAALTDHDPAPTAVPAVERKGVSPDLLAQSMSRRPILLIGDVGVGKTIFLRHLMKVEAVHLFETAIALYLDLGSQATLAEDLRSFVVREIREQLVNNYDVDIEERNFVRAVYHLDLERFSRSVLADLRETDMQLFRKREIEFLEEKVRHTEEHIRRSLEHIVKGRRKQVVIFLDNADQRREETQQEAFLIAQELAERWPVAVFVALRPETFHRSQRTGTLSGYHPKAFTISPPRIDDVLRKRLSFALKLTRGEIPIHGLASEFSARLEHLDAIIRVFMETIGWSAEIVELVDNTSGGNVRLALDLVKGFFGSGHVDTQKIVRIFETDGRYYIPLHEFLRAVLFGDSIYYDPQRSSIANIFDVAYSDPKEHFIVAILLAFLIVTARAAGGQGFVETGVLYEKLQGLGFTVEQVDAAIVRAHGHKLLETTGRRVPLAGQPMPPAVRANTVGAYHVERLPRIFSYIDAVIIDTPIFDGNFRHRLRDVDSVTDRLRRAEVFREYLDLVWATLGGNGTIFDWPHVSQDLQKNIDWVRRRFSARVEDN